MKKGYFFSLEVLISVLIILFSLLVYQAEVVKYEDKDWRIREALAMLEKENKINSENLENELEDLLGFDINISENCTKLRYFVVLNAKNFKVINICY
jgi:hypothetical protein